MNNINADLDKYANLWDKALKDGFMDDSPHLPPPNNSGDFFGQWDGNGNEDVPINECDAKYWDKVYRLSTHQGEAPDPLKEDHTATSAEIKKMNDRIYNTSNPIYPDSAGKDQEDPETGGTRVTPNWTDGKELQELAELKKKLEKLENQMNADEGNNKSGESVQKQIDSMRQKLDDLSDSLTHHDRYNK